MVDDTVPTTATETTASTATPDAGVDSTPQLPPEVDALADRFELTPEEKTGVAERRAAREAERVPVSAIEGAKQSADDWQTRYDRLVAGMSVHGFTFDDAGTPIPPASQQPNTQFYPNPPNGMPVLPEQAVQQPAGDQYGMGRLAEKYNEYGIPTEELVKDFNSVMAARDVALNAPRDEIVANNEARQFMFSNYISDPDFVPQVAAQVQSDLQSLPAWARLQVLADDKARETLVNMAKAKHLTVIEQHRASLGSGKVVGQITNSLRYTGEAARPSTNEGGPSLPAHVEAMANQLNLTPEEKAGAAAIRAQRLRGGER